MKKLLLSAVSATALLVSASTAYAEEQRTTHEDNMPHVTSEELKEGWENTKDAVSETATDAKNATKKAYGDIKAAILNGDEVTSASMVTIVEHNTASYLIGQQVVNDKKEPVAKVNDIIINKDGNAQMVVLGDGNITGWGKQVAYDYDVIAVTNPDGVVFAPLSEDMISMAKDFSYDHDDTQDKETLVIPMHSYSLNDVLGQNITDQSGKFLAKIEDATVTNGAIDSLIISYNQTLGLGGERVALAFDDVSSVEKDGALHFQLDAQKSAQFEVFKNTPKQTGSQ